MRFYMDVKDLAPLRFDYQDWQRNIAYFLSFVYFSNLAPANSLFKNETLNSKNLSKF